MNRKQQAGFTLIEVLVISPIMLVAVMFALNFLFNQYGQITQKNSELNLRVESQNILFGLQDDIFYASEFTTTKNSNLADSYSSGWSGASITNRLITSYSALTTSRRDANRQFVYINEVGCTVPEDNSILYNNTIYFVSGSNLYKRTLTAPDSLSTCGTSFFRQTCPSNHASASCPADKLLTDKLQSFTITYYTEGNSTTGTPENATKVKADIVLADKAFAEPFTVSSSLTLRKANQ